jgi:hypothetical protein
MFLALALAAVALSVSLPASVPSNPAPSNELTGTVKGSDGKPMEGVTVTARAQGASFTTSVWTNQNGAYAARARSGPAVWAQAVGFDRPRRGWSYRQGDAGLYAQAPSDLHKRQMSTAEWIESLPADTSRIAA